MLTPRFNTRTIAAGGSATITAYGRHILVVSISASTIVLGIDDESPHQILSREHIDCEDRKYTRVLLQNVGGVPSTIVVIQSETRVEIEGDNGLLGTMAASLAAIDADTTLINGSIAASNVLLTAGNALLTAIDANSKPYANHLRIPRTTIAQIGAFPPFTQIVVATAITREVELVCGLGNAGSIYLACANDVTDVLSFTELQAGASWNRKISLPIFACSDNGTETLKGSIWW